MNKQSPDKTVEEKVGGFLGRMVGKARKSKMWKEAAEAFEQGRRGEDAPPKKT